MRLDTFKNPEFDRGASRLKEFLWIVVSGTLFASSVPGSRWRVALLRLFGAKIGAGVVIKPRVRVKFPWRLAVGEHCWLGEGVWIDNLAQVKISDHVCVSQGVYLCTGSHDWSLNSFDLVVKPISIGRHSWLGAMSRVAPGVSIAEGAVLGFGSIAKADLQAWSIYFGCPAEFIKERVLKGRGVDAGIVNAL